MSSIRTNSCRRRNFTQAAYVAAASKLRSRIPFVRLKLMLEQEGVPAAVIMRAVIVCDKVREQKDAVEVMAMKVWQCEVYAHENLTLPCVIFFGKFTSAAKAMEVLLHQLSEVKVLLHPGEMREVVDDGSYTDTMPFRMIRFSATGQ
jgi:hypothetical protein